MTETCFDSRAVLLNQRSKRNMVELIIVVTLRVTYSIYSRDSSLTHPTEAHNYKPFYFQCGIFLTEREINYDLLLC